MATRFLQPRPGVGDSESAQRFIHDLGIPKIIRFSIRVSEAKYRIVWSNDHPKTIYNISGVSGILKTTKIYQNLNVAFRK